MAEFLNLSHISLVNGVLDFQTYRVVFYKTICLNFKTFRVSHNKTKCLYLETYRANFKIICH